MTGKTGSTDPVGAGLAALPTGSVLPVFPVIAVLRPVEPCVAEPYAGQGQLRDCPSFQYPENMIDRPSTHVP